VPSRFSHRFDPPDLSQLGITPLTPSLILGAQADPYPAAEAVHQRTRRLLEHLPETIGLEISILTRSPLLLRDLDLLVDLDQRHVVTVGVLIPAADPRLARRLERRSGAKVLASAPASPTAPPTTRTLPSPPTLPTPPTPPTPDDRFELVRALAAQGIATEVLCTPIRPGENSSTAVLRELFDRAHQAGAFDVRPAPIHPSIRPTAAESQQLLALFRRLRLERGFPRVLPGRG
jgi:DNA repair photolyase